MAFSFSQAKEIPIIEYLSRLGFQAARVRGNDHWYHSPFRGEKEPSFKVNTKLNVWYDHGSGEGGTLIDLGAKLNQCSVRDFVGLLENVHQYVEPFSFHKKSREPEENRLIILSEGNLKRPELVSYINGRGISESIAGQHCREIEFRIGQKVFHAIGFRNVSGGFELRNSWFKGSSSPKDISFINNQESKLCLLEGFIDFLSLKQLHSENRLGDSVHSDFLILNSLSFLKKSTGIASVYNKVIGFLDNDQAGKKAKGELINEGVKLKDESSLYADHKDLNEYLTSRSAITYPSLSRKRGTRIGPH